MEPDEVYFDDPDEPSRFALSVVMFLALVLLLVAFVWFVVRLDPLTSDFIETDGPNVTVTAQPDES